MHSQCVLACFRIEKKVGYSLKIATILKHLLISSLNYLHTQARRSLEMPRKELARTLVVLRCREWPFVKLIKTLSM